MVTYYLHFLSCNAPRGLVLRLPIFLLAINEINKQRLCIGNTFDHIWLCLPIIAGRT
jgi:hypothetical protein